MAECASKCWSCSWLFQIWLEKVSSMPNEPARMGEIIPWSFRIDWKIPFGIIPFLRSNFCVLGCSLAFLWLFWQPRYHYKYLGSTNVCILCINSAYTQCLPQYYFLYLDTDEAKLQNKSNHLAPAIYIKYLHIRYVLRTIYMFKHVKVCHRLHIWLSYSILV